MVDERIEDEQRPLAGRRILFFCSAFFGYEKVIAATMSELGAQVVFRGDRPYEAVWFKILLRLFPRVGRWIAGLSHNRWLEHTDGTFDLIFVLKGEGVSRGFLGRLKHRSPDARFVLYLWDSLRNVPGVVPNLGVFDRIVSFDREDCQRHPTFHYRSLFFQERYWNQSPTRGEGVFFLGTMNGDRPRVVWAMARALHQHAQVLDYWLFIRSGIEYGLRRLVDRALDELEPARFIRKPLAADEVARRFADAAAILDIQHPDQAGLTMRTFEVIASGKKLITTNPHIAVEPFYDSARICIVDRTSPHIPPDFLSLPVSPVTEDFRKRYGIHGWVRDVLSNEDVLSEDTGGGSTSEQTDPTKAER